MRVYEELLAARQAELNSHLTLITELNAAAIARQGVANLKRVETEHVEILKSGFLVHLYNVVQSVMDLILGEVAAAAVAHPPAKWSEPVRTEWVRARAGIERDLRSDERLSRVVTILQETIGGTTNVAFNVKTEWNWTDQEIDRVSERLGCLLSVTPEVRDAACVTAFQDNFAPMRYVRHKRNLLAHGNETFASGARLLSPSDLGRLRDPVLAYMSAVSTSYTQYLDADVFLHHNAAS